MNPSDKQGPTLPDFTWAWDVLWVGFLVLYAFAGYRVTPFHGDESMQIFMSRDYAYQFIERDMRRITYNEAWVDDLEQNLRLINGTVNKYTIGAAWHRAGFTLNQINWPWYWEESYDFNMAGGFYPGDDLLLVSRVPSTLFLAASVIVMFAVGRALAGRPVAYMATAYYALSPIVLVNGRRAMMEGSLLLGGLLTLLAGILLVQNRGWRAWAAALLLAFGAGFAVASKHTNVITVAAVFIGCGVTIIIEGGQEGWRRFGIRAAQVITAGLLSIALFLALNPAWWGNPVHRAQVVLAERVKLLEGQTAAFGGYANLFERLAGFYRQVFPGVPMYFEADSFREPLAGQIAVYEASLLAGVQLPGVALPMFVLTIAGLLCLLKIIPLPDVRNPARWVIGVWALMTSLFLVLSTPLEWQRYYLPVVPVVGLLASLGIVRIVRLYTGDAARESRRYKRGRKRNRPKKKSPLTEAELT